MLTIHQLIKRMRKCDPNVRCGVDFNCDGTVSLRWNVYSKGELCLYVLTFTEHQLTVECNDFQRAMMQAQIDMASRA